MKKNVLKSLCKIQGELNVQKKRRNSFGKYNYRSAEDILDALKPLLSAEGCVILLSDKTAISGDRFYIESTAKLVHCESGEEITVSGHAREELTKKGMDGSQITGASSSYARKYALNGLFAIDDSKDSDTDEKPNAFNIPAPDPEGVPVKGPGVPAAPVVHHCVPCKGHGSMTVISQAIKDYGLKYFNVPACLNCQKVLPKREVKLK